MPVQHLTRISHEILLRRPRHVVSSALSVLPRCVIGAARSALPEYQVKRFRNSVNLERPKKGKEKNLGQPN